MIGVRAAGDHTVERRDRLIPNSRFMRDRTKQHVNSAVKVPGEVELEERKWRASISRLVQCRRQIRIVAVVPSRRFTRNEVVGL